MSDRIQQLAYLRGALAARQKLATVAGPIAHSGTAGDNRANEKEELWAEFDREPFSSGGSG